MLHMYISWFIYHIAVHLETVEKKAVSEITRRRNNEFLYSNHFDGMLYKCFSSGTNSFLDSTVCCASVAVLQNCKQEQEKCYVLAGSSIAALLFETAQKKAEMWGRQATCKEIHIKTLKYMWKHWCWLRTKQCSHDCSMHTPVPGLKPRPQY